MFITPAVAEDRVFVGSCSGKLYALADSTGDILWSYDTTLDGPPAQFHGDPLLTGNGLIIGTDADSIGHLYGFERARGAVLWKHAFAGGFPSQVVSAGPTAFAMTGGNEVVAVDIVSGSILWRAHGPPGLEPAFNTSDPVVTKDRLVVGWRAGYVDALDTGTGDLHWRTSLLSDVNTSVFLHADTVAVGTVDGLVHRLRLIDGAELGRVDVGGMPFGDIVSTGRTVLLLTKENQTDVLTAWTLDFERKVWTHVAAKPWSTFRPAVQGNLVLVGWQGELIQLDLTTGAEVRNCDVDGSPRGLAWLGPTAYVGMLQGAVLRLQAE